MDHVLVHLVGRAEWEGGAYRPPSLDGEGFVHLSRPEQVPATLKRFYAGRDDVLAVCLALDRLDAAQLQWARSEPGEPPFPHLHGELDPAAVLAVVPLGARRGPLPAAFAHVVGWTAAKAVPVLPTADLERSAAFYARLGFLAAAHVPGTSLVLKRGVHELHLLATPDVDPVTTSAGAYLRVADVDRLFAEWRDGAVAPEGARGAPRLQGPPADQPHGAREFALVDPDGALLRVGQDLRT